MHDPAGAPWEVYTVKDDDPALAGGLQMLSSDAACCTPNAQGVPAC